jgi:hypothetical protein
VSISQNIGLVMKEIPSRRQVKPRCGDLAAALIFATSGTAKTSDSIVMTDPHQRDVSVCSRPKRWRHRRKEKLGWNDCFRVAPDSSAFVGDAKPAIGRFARPVQLFLLDGRWLVFLQGLRW